MHSVLTAFLDEIKRHQTLYLPKNGHQRKPSTYRQTSTKMTTPTCHLTHPTVPSHVPTTVCPSRLWCSATVRHVSTWWRNHICRDAIQGHQDQCDQNLRWDHQAVYLILQSAQQYSSGPYPRPSRRRGKGGNIGDFELTVPDDLPMIPPPSPAQIDLVDATTSNAMSAVKVLEDAPKMEMLEDGPLQIFGATGDNKRVVV